jgi:hypothetical protein
MTSVKYNKYNTLLECIDEFYLAQMMTLRLTFEKCCVQFSVRTQTVLVSFMVILSPSKCHHLFLAHFPIYYSKHPIIRRCSLGKKGKVVSVNGMNVNVHKGSGGIAPLILNLGSRWR